jgi:nitroimidazol reductase NimA-like FMN-containing flavoprotein (pyridoxamine 5'-phosphate oxidase superfamily)
MDLQQPAEIDMTTPAYTPTPATLPTRHKERVGYDRPAVHAIIDEAVLCHVGFVVDGQPVVLPQLHARLGEDLYLHGSTGARGLRMARADGLAVCVTITHLDGLVLARSAFNHSANYRSVVLHGRAVEVTDRAEKERALAGLVDAIVPGRSEGVRGASGKELAATSVLRLALEAVSLKIRTGPPGDDEDDVALPYWAGVLPLTNLVPGTPQAAPDLNASIGVPNYVTSWSRAAPVR